MTDELHYIVRGVCYARAENPTNAPHYLIEVIMSEPWYPSLCGIFSVVACFFLRYRRGVALD